MAEKSSPTVNESDFDAARLNQRMVHESVKTETRSEGPSYRMNLEAVKYAENSGE